MKRVLKIAGISTACIISIYILVLAAGFFGVKYGLTDVEGEVDEGFQPSTGIYEKWEAVEVSEPAASASTSGIIEPDKKQIALDRAKNSLYCKIQAMSSTSTLQSQRVAETYAVTGNGALAEEMIHAFGQRAGEVFRGKLTGCELSNEVFTEPGIDTYKITKNEIEAFPFAATEEWQSIEAALKKDKETIDKAAAAAGVESRLVVSTVIVEQLRLHFTQRELFEKVFKPLSILANASKMAWGIMAIKEPTAIAVEEHLKDNNSPFYLGTEYERLLDFTTDDPAKERYARLTDEKDHYYSYLYGALYLKQIGAQWENAGYPVLERPEIMATLYNIGFKNSKPKKDPQVGGSKIDINGTEYSFGSLAYEFYYSGILAEEFPYTLYK